ncbi:hypothetical protein [Uliginosibacterium sediminicola]|uniref:Secreted protein n=1 Tax=Uliginosibacterium sediminicola TaxID=2024550 RepID=A0ABU9YTK8_9RHOO
MVTAAVPDALLTLALLLALALELELELALELAAEPALELDVLAVPSLLLPPHADSVTANTVAPRSLHHNPFCISCIMSSSRCAQFFPQAACFFSHPKEIPLACLDRNCAFYARAHSLHTDKDEGEKYGCYAR